MIKKLIGIALALAVIGIIVVVALHHDKYTSMITASPSKEVPTATVEKPVELPVVALPEAEVPAQASVDSVALHAADSVVQ